MSDVLIVDTAGLLKLTVDDMLGKSIAVLGIKGYGKSNTAAVLAEEMLQAGVPTLPTRGSRPRWTTCHKCGGWKRCRGC